MWLRLCALALVLLASGCAAVQKSLAPDPLEEDLARYDVMFERGFFDDLISDINQRIESLPAAEQSKPDPRLLHYRGASHYNLGWFEEAKTDLLAAQTDGRKVYETKSWLDNIARREALLPPYVQEIREGDRVLFRMHYFAMNDGTASVAALLPTAYHVSQLVFGSQATASTVYVFDTYDQFTKYYAESSGGDRIGNWIWAFTQGNTILICLQNPDGKSVALEDRQYFLDTITHEVNHVMLCRLVGWTNQPDWFKEGLAEFASAQANVRFDAGRKQTLEGLFQNNLLVPMEKLSDYRSFTEQTEMGHAMRRNLGSEKASDPYAQSYGMMKFLLATVSRPQLQSFLRRVRASDDFDGSFATEFGMTTNQFYEKWKAETARQLAAH